MKNLQRFCSTGITRLFLITVIILAEERISHDVQEDITNVDIIKFNYNMTSFLNFLKLITFKVDVKNNFCSSSVYVC